MYTELSSDFKDIQDILDITIQDYYAQVYDLSKNPIILKFLPERKLLFTIEKQEFVKGKYPVTNAFSIYRPNEDVVIITEKLAEMIQNLIYNAEPDNNRAACMLDTALLFCAFHELGHLLLGHCQLQKEMRMCAIENSNENKDIDIALYQQLETDTDMFAAKRIGEKMMAIISDGKYRSVLGYNSIDAFYKDILKGINAFFYILIYKELLDARESYMLTPANEPPKGYRENEITHIHPPALARCYYSGKTLMEHLHCYFHIPPKDEYFMDILYSVDYIFGGIKRDAKQREDKYNFDKKRIEIFDDKLTAIKQEWLYNTRKIIAPYSRICII